MFSQTFVGCEGSRKSYTLLLSTTVQVVVVAALTIAPLIYMQALPSAQLRSLLFAPPKPPVLMLHAQISTASHVAPRMFSLDRLRPIVPLIQHQTPSVPEQNAPGIPASGNEASEGLANSWGGELLGQAPAPPPTAANTKPSPGATPVKIGGLVAEANLVHRVQPNYPALARSARVSGTVRYRATISKNGTIENLQLISGHPLLVAAAREAILQWRYRPTLLNGEPVEVITEISVLFSLSN